MAPALQNFPEDEAKERQDSRSYFDKGGLFVSANVVTQLISPASSPVFLPTPSPDEIPTARLEEGIGLMAGIQATEISSEAAGKASTMNDDEKPVSLPPVALARSTVNAVRRLSANEMAQLTESLPIAAIQDNCEVAVGEQIYVSDRPTSRSGLSPLMDTSPAEYPWTDVRGRKNGLKETTAASDELQHVLNSGAIQQPPRGQRSWNSTGSLRTLSTPPISRRMPSATRQPPPVSAATSAAANVSQAAASSSANRWFSHSAAERPSSLHIDGTKASVIKGALEAGIKPALRTGQPKLEQVGLSEHRLPSPMPPSIPLPPMSLPTVLQLELAGQRPSPLYIYRSHTSDIPYESNAVKFERLKNFLLLPTYLERTMYFGALACLDAWLWTLTILPIRFCIAVGVLVRWWAYLVWKEVRWMTAYVWRGLGRMWRRGRQPRPSSKAADAAPSAAGTASASVSRGRRRGSSNGGSISDSASSVTDGQQSRVRRRPAQMQTADPSTGAHAPISVPSSGIASASSFPAASATTRPGRKTWHRRTKSMPSNLTPFHKADLLQGAVILCSSLALMNLDASRMYHFIRAQSAVKLYVIYNLVEVGDRLLSALGQDIFECLFSSETLSRTASGRSKILLPFGMFCLSLVYNIAHTMVLFYQVITLNVAVNSYSNALLSLLMSNQFVEVKSSVFKRTEKENTFQLACADIVERFQLWIVLFIIALRNVVEIGGLSVPGAGLDLGGGTQEDVAAKVPLHNASILPASFTILPSWLTSVEVLSPFLIVIGSEMIVDWIKHGYINKFNNIKPTFYSRVLDILCKDYYTNAFVAPALMRRLGLPLIPLCTLFLRSSVQTYHMFLATHLPSPLPPSTHTSLVVEAATPSSPAIAASLERLDLLIRNALGRAVHGNPYSTTGADFAATSPQSSSWLSRWWWSNDDMIAGVTMIVVFYIMFLILLIAKLLLGTALLRYARNRYAVMKLKEHAEALGQAEPACFDATGKRTGGYGVVEVGEDRRRWIFKDDPENLKKAREKERRDTSRSKKETDLNTIVRYEMVAKRIW
ncbi:hypothetical protein SEPCBS119000_000797 [Sporothrix epigloea]|uniref:Cytomegalovirus gH-receptor family protein n=1 Tax=Sporothrix epigloea TaxID=1892477 RepID=A0ABP0D8V4_9PEZI